MCLRTVRSKWAIADHDIICYKVLRLNRKDNHFYTPFRNAFVSDAILEGKGNFIADGIAEFIPFAYNGQITHYGVGFGAVHTYVNEKSAKARIGPDETIRKCVIPKGTEYVDGIDDFHCPCFAAKIIKFVKE